MNETVKSMRGYPLWSLLAIMTLLAALLAVPKTPQVFNGFTRGDLEFFAFHQLAIWALVGALIWIVTGRHRLVLMASGCVLLFVWGPLTIAMLEWYLSPIEASLMVKALFALHLYDPYFYFYEQAYIQLGYGIRK